MMKFSSEKDGHTLLSHQSCSTWCLVLLVFHTGAANWVKDAEQSVCVPRGTPRWSEGSAQGTGRKVRPEERSLSVNWSQICFHHILYLLMSPWHSINSQGNRTSSNIGWAWPMFDHNSHCPSFIPSSPWVQSQTPASSVNTWKLQWKCVTYIVENFPVI